MAKTRKRHSLGSFGFGREANELDFPQSDHQPPKNEGRQQRRHSLKSLGGSLGNIFNREADETDSNPLSEFQQQSLSVFESEHMWAHFKAHLAENKIQTAGGVRAMLPEFVNDRVLDGSVQSDRPIYPPSMKSSLPNSPNHSIDASERRNSIDYSQTLRGDAGHVRSLHETVNAEAQKNINDAKGLGRKVIPACLTSSLGWNDDPVPLLDTSHKKAGELKKSDLTESLTLDFSSRLSLDSSRRSLDLSSRRPLDLSSRRANFLASLGMSNREVKEKVPSTLTRRNSSGSTACRRPKFVRPVESSDRIITDIIEGNSSHSNSTAGGDGTSDSPPFSYRPSRSKMRDSFDTGCRTQSLSSMSRNTTDSALLVEWGENDELSSDDEVDDKAFCNLEDSERAVVIRRDDLMVDWNDAIDDDDWVEDALVRGISATDPFHRLMNKK